MEQVGSEMREKLLEDLAQREGVLISDLKTDWCRSAALQTLDTIAADSYTAEQWNYCLSYLTGQTISVHNGEEAKQVLSDIPYK